MFCWRSRYYLAHLFSVSFSAVLTYVNTNVSVKKNVLQGGLIQSLVLSSESLVCSSGTVSMIQIPCAGLQEQFW